MVSRYTAQYIGNNKRCSFKDITKTDFLDCTFTFPKQADVENLLPLKNSIHKLDANMINCVVKIMEQVYNESENRNFSLIPLLLAQLLNMLLASRKNLPENLRSENLLVQKTLRYIRDNYLDQNICLKNIAHAVGVSPSYLAAVFRREMQGLSIGNYIAKLKFYRSMELLNTTNMSMAEIAKNCGYSPLVISRPILTVCRLRSSTARQRSFWRISLTERAHCAPPASYRRSSLKMTVDMKAI